MQSQHSATIVYVMKIVSLWLTFVSVSWVFSNSFFALFFFLIFFHICAFVVVDFYYFFPGISPPIHFVDGSFFFIAVVVTFLSNWCELHAVAHFYFSILLCLLLILCVAIVVGSLFVWRADFFLFFCFNIFLSFVRLLH